MYIRGYYGDSPCEDEIISFPKYMIVKYKVEFEGEVYEEECKHPIINHNGDGDCEDSDREIEESIHRDTLGKILSWEFVGYDD